ncbi:MAG: secretin N-terminal domain-containing protein, partial [Acidobacteriota bacterium]
MKLTRSKNVFRGTIVFVFATLMSISATVSAQQAPQACKTYGCAGFEGERISLNVVNTDIRDILNYISEQYKINFVIDKAVEKVPVTVNVNNVPWNVTLDTVLRAQELGVKVNGPILRIAKASVLATENEIESKIRDGQLDSAPLVTEFIRLNYAFGFGTLSGQAGQAGQFTAGVNPTPAGMSSGSGMSQGGASTMTGQDTGIIGIVRKRLSRRGTVEVDVRSNTIIVTDVTENIDAVKKLVKLLDQPEPQVEIEARVVVANKSFSRDLGVQLSGLVLGNNGAAISGATLPGNAPVAQQNQNNNASQQRLNTGFSPNGSPNGVVQQPNGTLGSALANTVIGLTTGQFGTAQISAMLTMGEQKGQVKTIATPRVTSLNNRPAVISSGTSIPVTTVQPNSGVGSAAVVTTEYVEVPLRLGVTPQITDAGTVILNVVVENSAVASTTGGPPPIAKQQMQTQVMVPDGGTTVVGGA